jgi:hypothetical protein
MKRINSEWWKGNDGYYKQVSPAVYEGPFDTMEDKDPINLYNPPKLVDTTITKVVELDEPVSLTAAKKENE